MKFHPLKIYNPIVYNSKYTLYKIIYISINSKVIIQNQSLIFVSGSKIACKHCFETKLNGLLSVPDDRTFSFV